MFIKAEIFNDPRNIFSLYPYLNPYIALYVDNGDQTWSSKVHEKGRKNPVWNEECVIQIKD